MFLNDSNSKITWESNSSISWKAWDVIIFGAVAYSTPQ